MSSRFLLSAWTPKAGLQLRVARPAALPSPVLCTPALQTPCLGQVHTRLCKWPLGLGKRTAGCYQAGHWDPPSPLGQDGKDSRSQSLGWL